MKYREEKHIKDLHFSYFCELLKILILVVQVVPDV